MGLNPRAFVWAILTQYTQNMNQQHLRFFNKKSNSLYVLEKSVISEYDIQVRFMKIAIWKLWL